MSTAYSILAPFLSAPGVFCTLYQPLQQCSGLLEVGSVTALGAPAVNGRQQFAGFGTPTLLLPQTTAVHGIWGSVAYSHYRLLTKRNVPLYTESLSTTRSQREGEEYGVTRATQT